MNFWTKDLPAVLVSHHLKKSLFVSLVQLILILFTNTINESVASTATDDWFDLNNINAVGRMLILCHHSIVLSDQVCTRFDHSLAFSTLLLDLIQLQAFPVNFHPLPDE